MKSPIVCRARSNFSSRGLSTSVFTSTNRRDIASAVAAFLGYDFLAADEAVDDVFPALICLSRIM
jgi:hypothetical protein